MEAIWRASSRTIALLTAAAFVDAGSWCCIKTISEVPGKRGEGANLRDSLDLWVDGSKRRASFRRRSNGSRVSLESSEDESSCHSGDVIVGFGVREGLIRCGRLNAVRSDLVRRSCCCCVSEETGAAD